MDVVVDLPSGSVRGQSSGEVSRFLGVPFAASPARTGWLEPPEPVDPWPGVRDAVEFGATVPKNPYPWPTSELLEDTDHDGDNCLNLNVWTPDATGSGCRCSCGSTAARSATAPAPRRSTTAPPSRATASCCVTINYRLGVDGFLTSLDGGASNRGLLDQIAALRWVRENIAAFGGDPDRVTIGGESAGAMSVGALLSSPLGAGCSAVPSCRAGRGTTRSPATAHRTSAASWRGASTCRPRAPRWPASRRPICSPCRRS